MDMSSGKMKQIIVNQVDGMDYEGVDRYLLTERGVQVAGECEEMCG